MISHYYYNHNPQLPAMKKLLLPLKTSSAIKNPSLVLFLFLLLFPIYKAIIIPIQVA